MAGIHDVEIWVAHLERARTEWGWLLGALGFTRESTWADGESWAAGGAYLTLTTSPNMSGTTHNRRAPGVNILRSRPVVPTTWTRSWRPLLSMGGDTSITTHIRTRVGQRTTRAGWRILLASKQR